MIRKVNGDAIGEEGARPERAQFEGALVSGKKV
jgi:hypothetical protein